MRRLLEFKGIVVALALAGLAGLIILTAALSEARFQPAGPSPFSFGPMDASSGTNDVLPFPYLAEIFLIILGLTLLALIYGLLNPKTRKRILLALLRFVITLLILGWAMQYVAIERQKEAELLEAGPPASESIANFSAQRPEFVEPRVNSYLVYIISFVVALGVVALAWGILSRRPPARHAAGLEDVAGIARRALAGLQDGRDWDDAIIAAYVHMNEVVTAERGLIRQPNITPYEFAIRMEQMGLPGEAARTLTRLFEQVRYGGQASTRQERDLAVAALNAILRACGVPASSAFSYGQAGRGESS